MDYKAFHNSYKKLAIYSGLILIVITFSIIHYAWYSFFYEPMTGITKYIVDYGGGIITLTCIIGTLRWSSKVIKTINDNKEEGLNKYMSGAMTSLVIASIIMTLTIATFLCTIFIYLDKVFESTWFYNYDILAAMKIVGYVDLALQGCLVIAFIINIIMAVKTKSLIKDEKPNSAADQIKQEV